MRLRKVWSNTYLCMDRVLCNKREHELLVWLNMNRGFSRFWDFGDGHIIEWRHFRNQNEKPLENVEKICLNRDKTLRKRCSLRVLTIEWQWSNEKDFRHNSKTWRTSSSICTKRGSLLSLQSNDVFVSRYSLYKSCLYYEFRLRKKLYEIYKHGRFKIQY